jgi:hypothetical protein
MGAPPKSVHPAKAASVTGGVEEGHPSKIVGILSTISVAVTLVIAFAWSDLSPIWLYTLAAVAYLPLVVVLWIRWKARKDHGEKT